MKEIIDLLKNGTAISLSAIIALFGILINNMRATARQKKDRNTKMKVELLERIYNTYDDISDNYIEVKASLGKRFYEIQEEILEKGTEYKHQNYVMELYELEKKTVLFSIHKKKIIDMYKIKINADDLAYYIDDFTKKVVLYVDFITFITKLFVVKYNETSNSELANQLVIDELVKEKEHIEEYLQYKDALEAHTRYIDSPREESVKDYDRMLAHFNDSEKRMVSQNVSRVIEGYLNDLNKYGTDPFDEFEEQIVLAIKKLTK